MPNRWIYFHPRWPSLVAVIALAALVVVLTACSSPSTAYEDDSSYEVEDCDAEDRRTGDPDCAGHTTKPRTGTHGGTTTRPKTTKPKSYTKPRTYSPPRTVPRAR